MPEGLGTSLETVKRLCKDDKEALDLIDRATQNPTGRPQKTIDNVNSFSVPDGNSAAFALRRLRKDAPALHQKVLSGELSPHAAAIEAGFRKKTITVPLETAAAARVLKRHFTEAQIDEILTLLKGRSSE